MKNGNMMKKYLLDSVILIDHFNNIAAATEFIKLHANNCTISAITRAEVLTGFQNEQKHIAMQFLDNFELLVINKEIADLASDFRQTYRTKLPDALQASVAIFYDMILVSRNSKDFKEGQIYLGRNDLVLCPYQLP